MSKLRHSEINAQRGLGMTPPVLQLTQHGAQRFAVVGRSNQDREKGGLPSDGKLDGILLSRNNPTASKGVTMRSY